MKSSVRLVAVFALALGLVAGCGGENGEGLPDPADVAGEEAVTIELQEYNESGVSGTATVEWWAGNGAVSITVDADEALRQDDEPAETDPADETGTEPTDEPGETETEQFGEGTTGRLVAQVREGTCENPGAHVETLGELTDGSVTGTVQLDVGVIDWIVVVVPATAASDEPGTEPTEPEEPTEPGTPLDELLSPTDVLACGEGTGVLDEFPNGTGDVDEGEETPTNDDLGTTEDETDTNG